MRIFNTYGPRMRPDDGRAIPTFIRQALAGEPLTVAGDGRQTRSVCYVDDLVEGVVALLALDARRAGQHRQPARAVDARAGRADPRAGRRRRSRVVHVPRPEDDPTVRQPDITLAREALGWEPRVALADGLSRTIAWFRELPDAQRAVRASA